MQSVFTPGDPCIYNDGFVVPGLAGGDGLDRVECAGEASPASGT